MARKQSVRQRLASDGRDGIGTLTSKTTLVAAAAKYRRLRRSGARQVSDLPHIRLFLRSPTCVRRSKTVNSNWSFRQVKDLPRTGAAEPWLCTAACFTGWLNCFFQQPIWLRLSRAVNSQCTVPAYFFSPASMRKGRRFCCGGKGQVA